MIRDYPARSQLPFRPMAIEFWGVSVMDSIAPFKIRVCGIDELAGHCDAGVSHILSILDPN